MWHTSINADVAQLAEQLICNQQVAGSSPIVGSIDCDGNCSEMRNALIRQGILLTTGGLMLNNHLGQLNR